MIMHVTRFVTLLLLVTAHGGHLVAQTERPVEPVAYERLAAFADPRIAETSGVAVSRRYSGVLWTHNDSGDEPLLFATNLRGETLATFVVRGAENRDWEDIALGPCPSDAEGRCLYIADTGDNAEQRSDVAIYIVPEPDPSGARAARTGPSHRLTVTYPTGPHDVEALAVAPDGEISLITKGRRGSVYRFRIPAFRAAREAVRTGPAETLDIVPTSLASMVTGAAYSPDGTTLVIRTYTELHFYRREANGEIVRLGVPCVLGFREPQGEAVDFLDSVTLVLTSEAGFGQPAGLSRVRCPLPPARVP